MTEKFNGFSQDEIRAKNSKSNFISARRPAPLKRTTDKAIRQPIQAQKADKIQTPAQPAAKTAVDSSPVRLSDSSEISITEAYKAAFLPKQLINCCTESDNENTPTQNDEVRENHCLSMELQSNSGSNKNSKATDSNQQLRGISLKDYEAHHRMLEEQNRQKKVLVSKAIEQYTQKTAAETRRIEEIRQELSRLEDDLAADVAILRKEIESATIHFTNIEKQYNKIESQFLKAKVDLHQAAEKKELLTEHLCRVISHNEDRKAQKLTELMKKVGLTPSDSVDNDIINE